MKEVRFSDLVCVDCPRSKPIAMIVATKSGKWLLLIYLPLGTIILLAADQLHACTRTIPIPIVRCS